MNKSPSFPTVINSSLIGDFKACQYKAFTRYFRELDAVEKSLHLIAGGAFAKGLEVTRLALYADKLPPEEALHLGQLAAIKAWDSYPLCEESPKCLWRILEGLEAYFIHYGYHTDPLQPLMVGGKPAVEFSFALPIGLDNPETGEPLLYSGRMDMLATYQGALFCTDEKTTLQLGQQWRKQWDLRSQFTGYCWGAQESGYPVAGVVVRGISFLKDRNEFADVVTFRYDHLIQRWLETTRYYIQQMIDCWKAGKWIHQLDSSCTAYSGCPFQQLCDKEDPEQWIEGLLVHAPFRPFGEKG